MIMGYDRVGGMIWMILGVAFGLGSLRLGLGTLHKPGPGFMSFLTGCFLASLGLLLFLLQIRKQSREKRGENISLQAFWRKGVFALAASFSYVFLLGPLGFIAATFLLIFSLLKIMGTGKWVTPILISSLTAMVSHFIFEVWLRINFT